jgi:hypothetical protein
MIISVKKEQVRLWSVNIQWSTDPFPVCIALYRYAQSARAVARKLAQGNEKGEPLKVIL